MNEQKRSNRIFLAASGLVLAALAGTASVLAQNGEGESPSATPSPSPSQSQLQASTREVYFAQLNPAPGAIASGTAQIVVDGGQAGIFIQASGLAPNVLHEQHIHLGTACAGLSADTNQDGYVDAVEATPISGPPVLPLGFVPGQDSPSTYPVASQSGTVTYIGSLSMDAALSLLASATMPTPTETPGTAAATGLAGRVIEIHGTDPNTNLPSTVQSIEGKPASATLPQACGQIQRVTE